MAKTAWNMPKEPERMFLGETAEEHLATLSGQMAMWDLERRTSTPRERFRAFHALRVAARDCPNAAYNLGNYFSQGADDAPKRRHRSRYAMELFASAAEMGLNRIRDEGEPFEGAPQEEVFVRDIISRALTNIGGLVANAGRPDKAVSYFTRSIRIFPANANSHVCFGKMAILFNPATGLDAFDGLMAWKKAGQLGDYCHESEAGCPCRANVVAVSERIAKNYGKDVLREWLTERYVNSCQRRRDTLVVDVLLDPGDAGKVGRSLPLGAVAVGRRLLETGFADTVRSLPVEMRVTILASLLANLVGIRALTGDEKKRVLVDAVAACAHFEPLRPILAEEDWCDIGPPETDYLHTRETSNAVGEMAYGVVTDLVETIPALRPIDAAIGLMFHLDASFRRGVSSMVDYWTPKLGNGRPCYIPATFVGNPQQH